MLGTPDKAQWKNAAGTEEQESALTEKFKVAFEAFDFTLIDS